MREKRRVAGENRNYGMNWMYRYIGQLEKNEVTAVYSFYRKGREKMILSSS